MTIPASSLTLDLRPSRILAMVHIAVHLLAAGCLLLLHISVWRLLCGWILITLHALWVWRDTRWLRQVRQLHYRDGVYQVLLTDGREYEVETQAYLSLPWLTILSVDLPGSRRRYLPLLADSADTDCLRRLRVLLRTGA